ncbi:nucleolar protein 4-like [Mastacembelus armatus]|uniref:Nucleolar protein 4-like b n=1 Tax=Mastacembelus armatus TaxID=205130 RepID=A0A3Q3LBZ9_9TELE|nr:nucleolar protein 4-like [Mastacembelus armatus]XP_026188333.1 nucleolar protein 4-like [Mastacembelus armatus]XP_026188334.1 nucleolar protein 4-like [Mastacembelus armatus]
MTTRKANSVADLVTTSTAANQQQHQLQQRSRSSSSGVPVSEAPVGGAEMFGEFQDWCLRTYGDSGKTKTVTRRKYNKILQTLLQGDEENSNGVFLHEKSNNHINAKFKFWVKSKGFQVGALQDAKNGSSDRPVLYVPIKAACVDGASGVDTSLKRVAVVEDFFNIIYAMHVEVSTDPSKAPKHAGQKKTYKAIAETYAFLPREAVTRFLMSCGECQKRMHINTTGQDYKENDRPSSLASEVIDYNMPLTSTYMKQMKLQCMSSIKDDSSLSSEEETEMSEPTWLAADLGTASDLSPPSRGERMRHSPQNARSKEDDDDSSSESGSGNGLPALTPPSSTVTDSAIVRESDVVNGNSGPAPLDFSTPTSSSSSSEDQQPINLSEPPPHRLPLSTSHLPVTVSAAAAALLGALHPNAPEELRRKYPLAAKPPLAPHLPLPLPLPHTHTPHTHNANTANTLSQAHTHTADLRLDRDSRDYGGKSPQYSSGGSYDSLKVDLSAEDLTMGRHSIQVAPDDDDDDHDDHDDNDKINDTEGVDPERLKAFNMFVRLFVDENLDRMVPISKQPKEKIQAIIESCSRQFPEFQERARKRIRTYLKSCRRMKKNGMETRPTPPHLTSAMAENILAAACESESRNAAKRMRLEAYNDEQISLDKPPNGGGGLREPVSLAHSTYTLATSALSSQDTQLYINGAGLSYGYRGYPGLGAGMQHPVSLTTCGAAQSNGPTDLSMKSLSSNISNSSSSTASLGGRGSGGGGGGGASTQLSQPEITAVRQLIAGYRESAAFLLRSADELENLILQQN